MIGYKAFTSEMKCRDFFYQEGKTYEIFEPIQICRNGFHFCDVPINVLHYYQDPTDKYAIIEALGHITVNEDILVTNKIKIVKIISKQELLNECIDKVFKVRTGEYHFKNGELHRDNDLPALTYTNGTQAWYQFNCLHRDYDKPALICDRDQYWFKHGKHHRYFKPATICENGINEWWEHDVFIK